MYRAGADDRERVAAVFFDVVVDGGGDYREEEPAESASLGDAAAEKNELREGELTNRN